MLLVKKLCREVRVLHVNIYMLIILLRAISRDIVRPERDENHQEIVAVADSRPQGVQRVNIPILLAYRLQLSRIYDRQQLLCRYRIRDDVLPSDHQAVTFLYNSTTKCTDTTVRQSHPQQRIHQFPVPHTRYFADEERLACFRTLVSTFTRLLMPSSHFYSLDQKVYQLM